MTRRATRAAVAHRARWLAPLGAVLVTLAVLLLDGDGGSFALLGLRGRVATAERNLHAAQARRAALLERIAALRHDDLALESAAREQLGMLRDGELVLRWSRPDAALRGAELPRAAVD